MNNGGDLSDLVEEYRSSFEGECGWDTVETGLVSKHDWTAKGASHLVDLLRQYGSFVLRHAAALSLALEFEDGDLGL